MRKTATVIGHYASALNEVLLIATCVVGDLALVLIRRKDFDADAHTASDADAQAASAQGSGEADPVAVGCGRGHGRGLAGDDLPLEQRRRPHPRRLNSS